MIAQDKAIDFVRQLIHLYFEEMDYGASLQMLDENILCIGLKEYELCKSLREVTDFLYSQKSAHFPKYFILEQSYDAYAIGENCTCIYSEIKMVRENTSISFDIRLSAVCKQVGERLSLANLHMSYPSKNRDSLEENLRYKTIEMQTIYDNVEFGILKCRMDGSYKVRFLNNMALSLLGFNLNAFVGEIDISEFIPKEEMPIMLKNAAILRATDQPVRFKLRAKRQDGKSVLLDCYGAKLRNEADGMIAIYTIRDITEDEVNRELLISANRELVLSQKRYDIAISNMSDDFFDYIIGKNQILNHPSLGSRYGLPNFIEGGTNQVIETGVVHPNSIERFKQLFERIENGEETAKETVILISKDGKETVNEIKLANIYDENNKPIRAVGLISDITNKISLEQEQRYRNAMTSDRTLSYEANITKNVLTSINSEWSQIVGLSNEVSYSKTINYLGDTIIHTENVGMFKDALSRENIFKLCENGEDQISTEYRRMDKNGRYKWIKNDTNIIKDLISGDIKIRCYTTNIDEQKQREIKAFEEQRFYEAMVSKDAIVYEFDVTNNSFIRGYERWIERLGAESVGTYSSMLDIFIKNLVHPDDMAEFARCFLLESLLTSYHKGFREVSCEYRRLGEQDEYRWFSCSTHLFDNPSTGRITAFSYEQDIDEDHRTRLALIYRSEHDSLTEFYNKGTTEQLINNYLKSAECKNTKHAFIIFDIDFFKDFNDNFGHAFGDAVLSQTAKKVKELFREEDILGRIGGDEFVVFMKNVSNRQVVYDKSQNICDAVRASYSKNDKAYKVSVSLGIAFSQDGAVTYGDLYNHADTALYAAKEQGRDRFVTYQSGMISKGTSVNDMIIGKVYESRAFSKNISDYVFRILYESSDKINAINSVLELVGKQYHVSRTYIFEDSEDGSYTSNAFEWCSEEILPQRQNLIHVEYSTLGDYRANFNEDGIFFLPDVSAAPESIREILKP